MNLKLNLEKVNIDTSNDYAKAIEIFDELRQDNEEYTGWVNWPCNFPDNLYEIIKKEAEKISRLCTVLVVVGVGGSYLGTAAVAQAVTNKGKAYPRILFAGNNLSGERLAKVAKVIKVKDVCMCVVSKSGETLETKIAYKTIRALMEEKYGDHARERIVVVTDAETGSLRIDAREQAYTSFEIPRNIGGRYSAFTPAILFPLAVIGINIREFVQGGRDIAADTEFWKERGIKYALTRYELNKAGKDLEIFEYNEPSLQLLGEWCKQLFGESEGKNGKGLFPATFLISTELHSLGQYLQDGKPMFFETMIVIKELDSDIRLPDDMKDGLAGMSLNEVNRIAVEGAAEAHSVAGTPIIRVELKDKREYSLGQFMYFMMMTAGLTGKLMGVNPFTQDGVEQYKSKMKSMMADMKGMK